MKTTTLFLALFALSTFVAAQIPQSRRLEILETFARPAFNQRSQPSEQIKGIQRLDDGGAGIAYTSDAIFRTSDGGATWDALNIRVALFETISSAAFVDRANGFAVISSSKGSLLLIARTTDGGSNWDRHELTLDRLADHDTALDSSSMIVSPDGVLTLEFPLTTSSNFEGRLTYRSTDAGVTWTLMDKRVELRSPGDVADVRSGSWTLRTDGSCIGVKTGCVQETKLLSGGNDITPPQIVELSRIAKENARADAVPMFAAPPGGSTRISLNRGFDKCQAGSVTQMQTWWNTSPHYDSNIYMSGRNRACPTQPFTNNPAWIDQVSAMGWGLIPTIVGYQSPCTASTTTAKLSYDVAVAEQQGRGEADIAVADANSIGLTQGSILYYDMERYDPPNPDTLGCRPATVAFLKGWTDRIKELGYKSGTYGSPKNAQEDWVNLPEASRMDAIWMARWDNIPSVWTYLTFPTFPTNVWNNHQRIKQWQAPHNETWGGVTFNIDGNIADGPVAGIAVARNRTADFDGDLKTDISVFRPDTGVWYVLKSDGSGYIILQFGVGTDVVTPGDFDGDGKTDHAVFRPSDGTWHTLTKAGSYTARTFGTAGDIPAAADYNGDGKTDIAVFRPSTGVWYIANSDSLGTYTIGQFGVDGDLPVVGDYDGDGRADIAVYRPSSGVWYVMRSSDSGVSEVQFGVSTDRPAQADYDGDGKTDFAVLRDGVWYLLRSTAGWNEFQFGTAGDLAVPGDYDGDGKDDPAVFRPSTGVWYLLRSQDGEFGAQFGTSGDQPVPNSYLPQ